MREEMHIIEIWKGKVEEPTDGEIQHPKWHCEYCRECSAGGYAMLPTTTFCKLSYRFNSLQELVDNYNKHCKTDITIENVEKWMLLL